MVVDFFLILEVSWRVKLLGREAPNSGREEDFEFLDGDLVRSMVNGIPAINFSERIQQILFREMATTVVGGTWSSFNIIRSSYSWVKHALKIDQSQMNTGRNMNTCSILLEGWVFLNTDGSVRIKDDFATTGGVGILDGLNILIDHGLDDVMIQSNSLEVVITIQQSSAEGSNKALIKKILQLLSRISNWNIYYILRANSLAKLAHSRSQGLQMFGKP
ncbi:hypothetical protein Gorai_014689, partial [Gossypium raimondii]|nr:hypothetical protein [Gossypium raimondii]